MSSDKQQPAVVGSTPTPQNNIYAWLQTVPATEIAERIATLTAECDALAERVKRLEASVSNREWADAPEGDGGEGGAGDNVSF